MSGSVTDKVVIIIPSLDPDEQLPIYVDKLQETGFSKIVVVNDGSKESLAGIFDDLDKKGVTVLKHEVNRGKGRGLKTAFSYVLEHYTKEEIAGVVTADADGQHSPADTLKVAAKLVETGEFILGSRDFSQENVPPKSRIGNRFTSGFFKLLYGKKVEDTQTGLRGIPYEFLDTCCNLKGERFEYEIVMLIEATYGKMQILEEKIETIYIDSNRATHFHPVKDSVRIIGIMAKSFLHYALNSLVASALEVVVFALLTKLVFFQLSVEASVFFGTVIARVISSVVNYAMNRKTVFGDTENPAKSIVRYYILCVGQMLCSSALVLLLFEGLHWDTTVLKVIADLILYMLCFQIQRKWVFQQKQAPRA
jgi:dolichol-phosphate mannosyltransferase